MYLLCTRRESDEQGSCHHSDNLILTRTFSAGYKKVKGEQPYLINYINCINLIVKQRFDETKETHLSWANSLPLNLLV